jgi:hypothetical protein
MIDAFNLKRGEKKESPRASGADIANATYEALRAEFSLFNHHLEGACVRRRCCYCRGIRACASVCVREFVGTTYWRAVLSAVHSTCSRRCC